MENIKLHLPFLSSLKDNNTKDFKLIIIGSSKKKIDVICEFLLNILNNNLESSETEIKKLANHKIVLRKLCKKKFDLRVRKNTILRNSKFIHGIISDYFSRLEKKLTEWAEADTDDQET